MSGKGFLSSLLSVELFKIVSFLGRDLTGFTRYLAVKIACMNEESDNQSVFGNLSGLAFQLK
jgi:hypothetical protein